MPLVKATLQLNLENKFKATESKLKSNLESTLKTAYDEIDSEVEKTLNSSSDNPTALTKDELYKIKAKITAENLAKEIVQNLLELPKMIADEIDTYIKQGTVNTNVTTQVTTAGSAAAQTGAGIGSGVGSIT